MGPGLVRVIAQTRASQAGRLRETTGAARISVLAGDIVVSHHLARVRDRRPERLDGVAIVVADAVHEMPEDDEVVRRDRRLGRVARPAALAVRGRREQIALGARHHASKPLFDAPLGIERPRRFEGVADQGVPVGAEIALQLGEVSASGVVEKEAEELEELVVVLPALPEARKQAIGGSGEQENRRALVRRVTLSGPRSKHGPQDVVRLLLVVLLVLVVVVVFAVLVLNEHLEEALEFVEDHQIGRQDVDDSEGHGSPQPPQRVVEGRLFHAAEPIPDHVRQGRGPCMLSQPELTAQTFFEPIQVRVCAVGPCRPVLR